MIWRPRDDIKTMRIRTCSDNCVYVRAVVRGQIIPDKNAIVIGYSNAIDLNIITKVLPEISECIVGCTDVPHTPNLLPRIINTALHMLRKSRITRLDCKQDGELFAVPVVAIFPHPKQLQCPPLFSVASLNCHPKLINIYEHPLWHLKNSKGGAWFQKQ